MLNLRRYCGRHASFIVQCPVILLLGCVLKYHSFSEPRIITWPASPGSGRQPKFGIATGLSHDGDKAAVGGEASAPGLAACPIGKQSISICPRSRRALNFFRPQGVGPKISVKGTSAASLPCAMRLARTGCRYCVIEAVGFSLERLMAGEMMPSPNRKLPPSMSHSSSSGRYAASSL